MSKIDTIIVGIQQRYAKASDTNAEKYQSNPNNQVNTFRSNEEVLAYYASKAQEEFGLNSYDQQVAQAKQNLAQQAAVQAGQNKQLLENYQNSQRTVELPPEQEMIENASFIDKVNDSAIGLLKGTNNLVQMGLSVGDVLYNHSPVAGVNRVLDGKPYFSDKFSEGDVTQFAKNYLGIDPKGENEVLNRGYSTAYRQEADALHKAINDADGLLGKSIAGFKQGFDSPSLVLSTIAESAPELFIGGGAGAGLKALGLGGKTANAVGQGTAAYLGETARTALQSDDGSITHRENLINAGIGIATGGVARVMSNSVTPEGMFSGLNAAQRPTIKQGVSSIALAPVSAGKEFGKEGVSEYTEELVQGIGQQYRETGAVDLGEATGQAGFGAFVGSAMATPSASALLLNNTLEGAGLTSRAVTNQKIENKTNPEHKKYDPAFAYQKAEMDSKSGTLDTQAASEAQLTAMETALNKLDEFDTQLASMPNGKERDKLKKQRDQWFDTQVKPLQAASTSTGGVNQWGLSDDMDGDAITNTIINYSQIHYQLGQERLAQQAKAYEEASKPIEIPQYTNVDGTGTGVDNTQGIDFGIALSNQHKDVAYSITNGKNIANGLVDCSEWIDVINKNVVSQVEAKYGKEFAKQFRIDSNGGAAGQIQTQVQKGNGVNSADGTLFSKLDKSILKEGMLIGINTGDHAKDRYKSIGHIATVVKQNGQLYISESTTEKYQGKDGVRLITLDEFVNAHSKRGNGQRKAFIVDPYKALRGMQGGISTGTTTNTQQASTGIVTIGDSCTGQLFSNNP